MGHLRVYSYKDCALNDMEQSAPVPTFGSGSEHPGTPDRIEIDAEGRASSARLWGTRWIARIG
jgi:hypothetical protein